VRRISKPSAAPAQFIRAYVLQHQKPGRTGIPRSKALIDSLVEAAVIAIEEDRADSIILGGALFRVLRDEIRQALDKRQVM